MAPDSPSIETKNNETILSFDVERERNKSMWQIPQSPPIINDEVYVQLFMVFKVGVLGTLSALGIVTNALNILVFLKQGLSNSMHIQLVCLSLLDWAFCLGQFASFIFRVCGELFPDHDIRFHHIAVILAPLGGLLYSGSTLVTIFIAIERAVCVVFPLKVKNVFTKTRAIVVSLIVVIFVVICYIPSYATIGLRWRFDPKTNRTRLTFWASPNRMEIELFINTSLNCLLPILAQLTLTVSAGLLISGLRRSAKFRQDVTSSSGFGQHLRSDQISDSHEKRGNTPTSRDEKASQDGVTLKLSSRQVQLSRMVIFITLTCLLCNIPTLAQSASIITRVFIPNFSAFVPGPYQNVVNTIYVFLPTLRCVNASINIFLYLQCTLNGVF